MNRELKRYIIACLVMILCSTGLALFVCLKIPAPQAAWPHVIWFILLAIPAELITVYTDRNKGVYVSPGYAIHWAAVCVLGPLPAIVYVIILGFLVTAVKFGSIVAVSYLNASGRFKFLEENGASADGFTNTLLRLFVRFVRDTSELLTSIQPRWMMFLYGLHTISCMIFCVGLSGIVYYYTGGHFFTETHSQFSFLRNFFVPFIAVVVTSTSADVLIILTTALAVYSDGKKKSFFEIMLKIRLTAAEIFPPIVGPQLFSAVVGLSLAYLYVHLHLLGFAVAAAPVVTLRHFFSQWVAERDAYVGTITTLATYMQHYHPYTRGHLKRVADLSERLARELRLPVESIRFIGTAGMLHDIGKIGVSEQILDKTEKLTDEEWEKIKEHPVKGAEIIRHIEFLDGIVDWVKYHHKWYNGAGYPTTNGNDTQLPMEALIIATADAFDAMTDDRELTLNWKCDSCGYTPTDDERPDTCPQCGAQKRRTYRQPKTLDGAIEELRRGAGSQFHPAVVKAFLTMIERDGVKTNV